MRRIALLARDAEFSREVLAGLLDTRTDPAALLVPRSVPGLPLPRRVAPAGTALPLAERPSLLAQAATRDIPVYEIDVAAEECLRLLERLGLDAACVACFPWRIPASWLKTPRLGFLNAHPSLLPSYRGPAPLFWQLRAGETATGVTVHLMDERLDAGPIAAQQHVPFPDGASEPELEALLGRSAAACLAAALAPDRIDGRPQDETGASYQTWPGPDDLVLDRGWTARRAFNFVRGAAGYGPFLVETDNRAFAVREAIAWSERASAGPDELCVRFADAYVSFRTAKP
jgi:methionyl-tRNA formyltransferase